MSDAASRDSDTRPRRDFLGSASVAVMAGGLTTGYGLFAVHAGRFLFPAGKAKTAWQYVASLEKIGSNESLSFTTPAGAKILVARQGDGDTADQFIALSSVCPHLGCAVHWESENDRFFCPCHNGVFDAAGKATAGPPAAARQELKQFSLKVENGQLYIEVPTESINRVQES